MRALALLVLAAVAAPGAASADSLWAGMVETEDPYEKAMARADRYAELAQREHRRRHAMLIEKAALSYEEAIAARPDAAEPHYRLAELLRAEFLDEGTSIRRGPNGEALLRFDRRVAPRALRHYAEFERLAPLDPRIDSMLMNRALIHTKMGTDEHFELALADYLALMKRGGLEAAGPDNAAIRLYNCGETLMMLGRLDEALTMYQRSVSYANKTEYIFSLAVALDRDGQEAKARQILSAHVRSEGDIDRLVGRESGIFFVPSGELYYYLGLAFEVLGEAERARKFYEMFVDSGAHPRFHPRARAHIERLRGEDGET